MILGLDYGTNIDIWSLGGVLAEMYTGYVLFQASDDSQLLRDSVTSEHWDVCTCVETTA